MYFFFNFVYQLNIGVFIMEKKNELKKSFIEDYFKIVSSKKNGAESDFQDQDREQLDETNKYEIYAKGMSVKNGKTQVVDTTSFMIYKNEKLIYQDEKINIFPKSIMHRSEIQSIYDALYYMKNYLESEMANPNNFVFLYSDSEYATKCLTDWAKNWSGADWKTKKNAELVVQTLELSNKYNIYIRNLPLDKSQLYSKHQSRYAHLSEKC
jgi:ribonuclease HI